MQSKTRIVSFVANAKTFCYMSAIYQRVLTVVKDMPFQNINRFGIMMSMFIHNIINGD